MEFTNELLLDMKFKKEKYNTKFSDYYMKYYHDIGGSYSYDEVAKCNVPAPDNVVSPRLFRKSERILKCMDFWQWDKYEQNKILDLQKVNRCSNTRFCPNCKMLDVSKFIHIFRNIFEEYKDKGFKFYLLTLTVPSCEIDGTALKEHITRLSSSFSKLYTKFGYNSWHAYNDRYIELYGGIRVLEVTANMQNGFHPHYHCIVMLDKEPDPELMEKFIDGKYSYKRDSYNKHSLIDLQLSKFWGMIWYGRKLTKNTILNYEIDPQQTFATLNGEVTTDKVLQVDFRELDENGLYEVFKYTFKSSEVANFEIFKGLVDGLDHKRIRQGFGVLYNVKVDDGEIEEGEQQSLELAVPEDPVTLYTNEILSLVTEYKEYKKISRFQPNTVDGIED